MNWQLSSRFPRILEDDTARSVCAWHERAFVELEQRSSIHFSGTPTPTIPAYRLSADL